MGSSLQACLKAIGLPFRTKTDWRFLGLQTYSRIAVAPSSFACGGVFETVLGVTPPPCRSSGLVSERFCSDGGRPRFVHFRRYVYGIVRDPAKLLRRTPTAILV